MAEMPSHSHLIFI